MDKAVGNFKRDLPKELSGLQKASSVDECDFLLIFCPIVSRAGTDIDAAVKHLDEMKASVPAILVVLHCTFDPEKTIPDSSSFITRANTTVVDCLFTEDEGLLQCQKNTDAVIKTANYLKAKKLKSYYCLKDSETSPEPSLEPSPEKKSWSCVLS